MKHVYIVLSRSKTLVARMVQIATREKYSHSSLSLSMDCSTFYSFGRRDPRHMFPAGFITEGVEKGFFAVHPEIPIAVYELPVSDEDYQLIQERLTPFLKDPWHYKYAVKNLLYQYMGIAHWQEDQYVCSAFVAYILRGMLDFGKDPSLVFPHDFQHYGLRLVFEGRTCDYPAYYQTHLAQGADAVKEAAL